jgi:transposase
VDYEVRPIEGVRTVGIDPGLKNSGATSDGEKLAVGWFYRDLEPESGKTQRANNKRRVKSIHAKIKNRRKDAFHKFSTAIVTVNVAVFIGDVSVSKLIITKMAKSFRRCMGDAQNTTVIKASAVCEVANERCSTLNHHGFNRHLRVI